MSDASKAIAQQFAQSGVVPEDLTPVGGVSKTYVDAQDQSLYADIQAVAGAAASAQQTANSAQSAAQAAQQTANTAKTSAEEANNDLYNFKRGDELDIKNGAIVNRHLREESVTASKLAQKSVTLAKASDEVLDASNHRYSGAVNADDVQDAIDKVYGRVEYIIAESGDNVAELVDARIPETGAPFSTLRERLNLSDTRINDNPVKPEDFAGTDFEKLQTAFNVAFSEKRPLMISKDYDIGTNTITINKGSEVRELTKVFGGGRIKKSAPGYMFIGQFVSISDLFFDGLSFEGLTDNVDVFDCGDGKLIRLTFNNCYFKRIRNVFYTDTYLQDLKMYGSTIVNCAGALLDYQGAFGIYIDGITMENCTGQVIRHVGNTPPNNASINVSITRSVIEGFVTSKPLFEIARGSIILEDNYFEVVPAGVLKITGTATNVTVKRNTLLGLTNDVPFIRWGTTVDGLAEVSGNVSVLSPMNDTTSLMSGRVISSKNTSNFQDVDGGRRIFDPTIDVINNIVRKIGNNFYTVLVSKSIPTTAKVDLCTINPFLNTGLYVVVRGGGLQGNVGVFGINKTFKVTRSGSTLVVTLGADESWGDSANQKDNIYLEVSGTNLVLRANGRNDITTVQYDLFVEVYGRVNSVTPNY